MRTFGLIFLGALSQSASGVRLVGRARTTDNAYTDTTVSAVGNFGTNDGVTVDPSTGQATMTADSKSISVSKTGGAGGVEFSMGGETYGMNSRTFEASAKPISDGLSGYQAPTVTVIGCQPSDDGGRRNCKQGQSRFNLQIPGKIKAQ